MKYFGFVLVFAIFTIALISDGLGRRSTGQGDTSGINGWTIHKPGPAQEAATDRLDSMLSTTTSVSSADNFRLSLHADKTLYRSDEPIYLYAELVHLGPHEDITIWHGSSYVLMTVSDDDRKFSTGGLNLSILTSSRMVTNKTYIIKFQKTGGYGADDPDVDYLKKFYEEPELRLRPGSYTATAFTDFSLDSSVVNSKVALNARLKITVKD